MIAAGGARSVAGRRSAVVAALASPPNLVTLSRLVLIVGAFTAVRLGAPRLALLLGAAAGVSDYVDGWLARRTGAVTRLGEILDQFCDVSLELLCLVSAVAAGALPLGALVPWVLREVWVVSKSWTSSVFHHEQSTLMSARTKTGAQATRPDRRERLRGHSVCAGCMVG